MASHAYELVLFPGIHLLSLTPQLPGWLFIRAQQNISWISIEVLNLMWEAYVFSFTPVVRLNPLTGGGKTYSPSLRCNKRENRHKIHELQGGGLWISIIKLLASFHLGYLFAFLFAFLQDNGLIYLYSVFILDICYHFLC